MGTTNSTLTITDLLISAEISEGYYSCKMNSTVIRETGYQIRMLIDVVGIIFSPKVAEIALKPAVVIQKKRNLRKVIIFYL